MTTTVTDKAKTIKPSLGFTKLPDVDLLKRLDAIHSGMNGNKAFPNAPIDLAVFKTAVDTYHVLVTDALDGGKKATSAKRKQRGVVIKMATQLGHYVQAACNNDLAVFNTSGFVAATNTKTPPQHLPPAKIKWIDRGSKTGEIQLKVAPLRGAMLFEVRYAVVGAGGAPGPWTAVTLTSPKATTFNNLTPGATYAFQVSAVGKLGYTDWSDSRTFICG